MRIIRDKKNMAHEIETKVLDIDVEDIKKKLEELGAEKLQDMRLSVDWYRPKGCKDGEEDWYLRIRTHKSGRYECTWKGKSEHLGVSRRHKEINFLIDEQEHLADLFEELDLEKYAFQEKDRTSYSYENWQFDIDQYPGMPAFFEIEGNSEEHIKEGMKLLGCVNNRTWNDGEKTLINRVYNLDWNKMKFSM